MLRPAVVRPLDADEIRFRKRALRDAVMCIGWMKLFSASCYVLLFFLVRFNSVGKMSTVIQSMVIATVGPQIIYGLVLFVGALEEKICALETAIWLCLLLSAYNTVLGVVGGIYFIRTGNYTAHFFLAIIFAVLALSLLTMVCHDLFIIYAYKSVLKQTSNNLRPLEPSSQDPQQQTNAQLIEQQKVLNNKNTLQQ